MFEILHPNQASLVERLVARERVRVALVAPTGTGKTRAVMAAIERLTRSDPSTTALVVAPSAIGGYIAGRLRDRELPARVQHLKGADLRLQEKTVPSLGPGVYVISSELTRQSWVREVLVSLPWSLAFVDEAHYGGRTTGELIAQLARSETTQRLCAASATGWAHGSSDLDVITWAIEPIRKPTRRVAVVDYERSPEEIAVREGLTAIEEKFGADPRVRGSLDSAWRSSASALEFVLARHASLLDVSHADARTTGDPIVRERTRRVGGSSSRSSWSNPDGASVALQDLLREVGKIGRDSKLDAFLAYIELQPTATKKVVFTAMRQTAIYIAAALESRGIPASVIDGARAASDRVPTDEASVVIVTDAVLPAVDLSLIFEGISYDLPWDPKRVEARWSNLGAGANEAVMAILSDVTHSDLIERRLAQRHALISELFDSS